MTITTTTRLPVLCLLSTALILLAGLGGAWPAGAQENLPWKEPPRGDYDVYREVPQQAPGESRYENDRDTPPSYVPPRAQYDNESGYGAGSAYNRGPDVGGRTDSAFDPPQQGVAPAYRDDASRSYAPPRAQDPRTYDERAYDRADYDRGGLPRDPVVGDDYGSPRGAPPSSFSQDEIVQTGHQFFGSVSQGLAKVVEKAFREQGRPNGYILGEDAGGAFVAGLRYGEGTLYTRDAGTHRVYWQGPTIGYDFGAEGSKTMVLIYNMRSPEDIYQRFGGVQGSAYIVGGVGLQVMRRDDLTLAPIRSGVGLRLGANIGYLKYTRSPTWNPF
ncbi:MAG: hypothetical protein APF80_03065 [Alphaproteobacteria bacterium BRH_c36]|nr:MAG: hypothetical protein APF80_03065 [Alphaproteobacteria bacterium BRH_c36]